MGLKKGRGKAKSEATRKSLLAAAVKVIGSKGYGAATVDTIAEEAGVSKGVVYYYFKTKADIATQVLREVLQNLLTRFEQDVKDAEGPYVAMTTIIRDFSESIFDNKEAARFVLNELWRRDRLWSDEMRDEEERLMSVIVGLLKEGIEEGNVRPDLDLEFTAAAVTGTVLMTAQYYLLRDEAPDVSAFSDLCVDHIHHVVRPD